jgi:hypothetical protein
MQVTEMNQNRAQMRSGIIATALGVLVTLGLIISQTPNGASVYLADSPPAQAGPAHATSPVATGAGLAAILGAIR